MGEILRTYTKMRTDDIDSKRYRGKDYIVGWGDIISLYNKQGMTNRHFICYLYHIEPIRSINMIKLL